MKEFLEGPDDPNYILLNIEIKKIEYSKPGIFKVERLPL